MPIVDEAVEVVVTGVVAFVGTRGVFLVGVTTGATTFFSAAAYPHFTQSESNKLGLISDAISPEAHGRLTHNLPMTVA
jgi:hypothetical protein